MKQIPEKIYLQIHGDAYVENIEDVSKVTEEDVTWCIDKVNDNDIEYRRAKSQPERSKRVYISLPITGYSLNERKAYAAGVAWWLEREGFTPVNPLENGISADAPIEEHYRKDLHDLADCGGVIFCEGWQDSKGCKLEHCVALACGLNIADTSMRVSKQLERLKNNTK